MKEGLLWYEGGVAVHEGRVVVDARFRDVTVMQGELLPLIEHADQGVSSFSISRLMRGH